MLQVANRAAGNKEKLSLVAYVSAIPLAFVHTWVADAIYVAVAAIWLVPDRRIEQVAHEPAK